MPDARKPDADPSRSLLKRPQLVISLLLVLLVVAVGVTFGHSHRAGGRPKATRSARVAGDATLSGAVEGCGGPAPGHCTVTSIELCAPSCLTTSYVVVKTAAGKQVASAPITHGRFSVTVAPGAYTLELLATGKGGASSVFQTRHATVRRSRPHDVTFKLSIF